MSESVTHDDGDGPGPVVTGRRLVAAAVALLVVAGLLAGVSRLGPDDATTAADLTTEPFKTGTVTTGDLAVSDRLEGTLERTDELVVVHRISGATPGVTTSAGSGAANGVVATGAGPSGAGNGGLVGWFRPVLLSPALVTQALCDADAPTTTASSTSTSSTTPSSAVDPSSTTTSTTEPSATTSSTTATTAPPGSDPSVTVGADQTSTTAIPPGGPCQPTTTTAAPGNTPAGGSPGASVPGGGSGLPSGAGGVPAGIGSGGARIGAGGSLGGTGSSASGATSTPREMVTSVAAAGTVVASGDVLYSVEGRPVVALTGASPAWRDLASGVDDGTDVTQLEAALAALGYDDGGALTVDDHWDRHTTTAVEAWQTGRGQEATGQVPLGTVVFIPTDTTVTAVNASVGQDLADGDAVLRLATPSQQVVATVPAELRPVVAPGLAVEVSGVAATVTRLGSTSGTDGTVGVVAYITPNGPITGADGSAVSARFTVTDAAGVLLVPVDAVTSRIDGSYAVLAVDDSGRAGTWVPIEVHGVANGQVAATGDGLQDGLTIALPGDVATP